MRDFTADRLQLLLSSLISAGYGFATVAEYLHNPSDSTVILRHDVDARPVNSLKCAEMEYRLGISGTYYFRTFPGSYNKAIIAEIYSLGHEIGYHYEDLAVAHGDYRKAISGFEQNLAKLRRVAPVETICMHGSPMSKHDNRLLWQKYDYRDFGICGEPYLDIDFSKVYYLTDTGRCWNGDRFNLRDRASREDNQDKPGTPLKGNGSQPLRERTFQKTMDIIEAVSDNWRPAVIMMTVHPQRWNNSIIPWITELTGQKLKNIVKAFIRKRGMMQCL